jgi:Uma2 family endonuclease
MSIAQELETSEDLWDDIVFPPSDLLSDEPPLETDLHRLQMTLLIACLEWLWQERNDFYVSGNLTIYYSPRQRKSEKFRGPDFFVVLGVERFPRKSWVVWQEDGKYPNVIVEILSPKTAATDRGLKKQLYQDVFRTPDYFWFDPNSLEFQGFHLVDGEYEPLEPEERGWLWSKQLGLYLGVHQSKLRFFSREGQLIPSPQEVAAQEQQQRMQTEQQLTQTEQQLTQTEQQLTQTEQQLTQTEQQLTQMESLLFRYRERFGELPE